MSKLRNKFDLLDKVDNVKEKLTDKEYMEIVESIAKIRSEEHPDPDLKKNWIPRGKRKARLGEQKKNRKTGTTAGMLGSLLGGLLGARKKSSKNK